MWSWERGTVRRSDGPAGRRAARPARRERDTTVEVIETDDARPRPELPGVPVLHDRRRAGLPELRPDRARPDRARRRRPRRVRDAGPLVPRCRRTMKRFVDHFAYLIHRPRYFGTPAVLVSTAAGAGHDAALGYLGDAVRRWGFHVVGRLGVNGPGLQKAPYRAKVDAALDELAADLARPGGRQRRGAGADDEGPRRLPGGAAARGVLVARRATSTGVLAASAAGSTRTGSPTARCRGSRTGSRPPWRRRSARESRRVRPTLTAVERRRTDAPPATPATCTFSPPGPGHGASIGNPDPPEGSDHGREPGRQQRHQESP